MSRLIRDAKNGSPEAFARLVEYVRPYLLLVANQDLDPQLRAKVGASDIVQETLLDAQRDIVNFRGTSERALFAWLREILLNDLRQTRRSYRGTVKRQVDREIPLQGQQWMAAVDVAADAATPGAEAVAREEAKCLEAAMARLPDSYRKVLRWRNWDNLTFEEIGRRIGRSAEASRKLWSRAVLQLQAEIES